jgi:hypothetical protein
MVNNSTNTMQGLTNLGPPHHCLEVIVHFVDISGIVDHHCLEVIVHFVDISGIVDHHCLEVIVLFVDISGIVDHNINKMNYHL